MRDYSTFASVVYRRALSSIRDSIFYRTYHHVFDYVSDRVFGRTSNRVRDSVKWPALDRAIEEINL
jgi:hypothetical protein